MGEKGMREKRKIKHNVSSGTFREGDRSTPEIHLNVHLYRLLRRKKKQDRGEREK